MLRSAGLTVLLVAVAFTYGAATHLRAGEITTVRDASDPLLYHITLILYTDLTGTNNNGTYVEQKDATVYFGDGSSKNAQRDIPTYTQIVPGKTAQNLFKFDHSYTAPGVYTVYFIGDNRNAGIVNIANSDQNNFYIETRITVDPLLGANSSPVLQHPPVDRGIIGQIYLHNPAAFDADGDSLTYTLIASRQKIGNTLAANCTNWALPSDAAGGQNQAGTGPATCVISPDTGTLRWDVPNKIGYYNLAIRITEHRRVNGRWVVIGFVVRDMQIIIEDSRNRPPKLKLPFDTCLVAGASIRVPIKATDPDSADKIDIFAFFGQVSPVPFTQSANHSQVKPNIPNGVFNWKTTCTDIRDRPYNITFQATDEPVLQPPLSDFKNWRVTVYGPPPSGVKAQGRNNGIDVSWDAYNSGFCKNADSIYIWRMADTLTFFPKGCDYGNPRKLGFTLAGGVKATVTNFRDSVGLLRGSIYSYRITATFPKIKGGVSYISQPDTAILHLTLPVFAKASVLVTDSVNGQVRLWWTKPIKIDPALYPRPYGYHVYRTDRNGTKLIRKSVSENDTTYIDSEVNTDSGSTPFYKLYFTFGSKPDTLLSDSAGTPGLSGTGLATGQANLTWNYTVPWSNAGRMHYVYREMKGLFTLIDSVKGGAKQTQYTDTGKIAPLLNDVTYRYLVVTNGKFTDPKVNITSVDSSQILSVFIPDTIAPCIPGSNGKKPGVDFTTCRDADCPALLENPGLLMNTLRWHPDLAGCDSDVVHYRIYYAAHDDDSLVLVGSTTDTVFMHSNKGSLAGCYQVTAIDRSGNESPKSERFCRDNCLYYNLPNIFTPNNDRWNNTFRPQCVVPEFVQDADLQVFNRWGKLVYSSNTPVIDWPGLDFDGTEVPSGVYYYIASVRTIRLRRADEPLSFKGYVQVLR